MTTRAALAVVASVALGACVGTARTRATVATASRDANADSSTFAALDSMVPALLARHHVPGIAIAYIEDGAVAWTRVYGEQAPGVPATTATLYNVASLTKPVFAEVMLQLVADGRIALDEPMAAHWVDPDLAADPRHRLLTPRMALSHRIGFPNWRPRGGPLRLEHGPGSGYHYSGEGYSYLARFAERKLGAGIDELARRYVFAPFGMRNTAFTRQPWFEGRIALPADGRGAFGEAHYANPVNGADLLYATVGDYAAFVVGAMRRTSLPVAVARQRDSIHSPDSSEQAKCRAKIAERCADRFGYGLGWSIMEYPGFTVRWHTGSDDGHKAMAFYFPERRRGVVLLTNGANGFMPMIEVAQLLSWGTPFAEFLRTGG